MYYLYDVQPENGCHRFLQREQTHLAGKNKNIICRYLKIVPPPTNKEPCEWEINIDEAIKVLGWAGNAFVIDIKPSSEKEVLLFQLLSVYGYSDYGWTPIMLKMREIVADESLTNWQQKKKNFSVPDDEQKEKKIVYTFLHLKGTVVDGKCKDSWNLTRPSSTNSTLLWPEAREFFLSKIRNSPFVH